MPKVNTVGHIRVRSNQLQFMVKEMEKNQNLSGIKASSSYTAQQKNQDWKCLANKLNSSGGAMKNVKAWQKCWSDKKSEVKKKYKALKSARSGGGFVMEKKLTPLEKRILVLTTLDATEVLDMEESEPMAIEHAFPRVEDCLTSLASTTSTTATDNPIITLVESLQAGYLQAEYNRAERQQEESCKDQLAFDAPRSSRSARTHQTPKDSGTQKTAKDAGTQNTTKDAGTQKTANKDAACQSMRVGGPDPIVIKADITNNVVGSEKHMATALRLCAEALQQHNDLTKRELELAERALAIKKQKADAFVGIYKLLQNKFSE